jgi:hypothetical protein
MMMMMICKQYGLLGHEKEFFVFWVEEKKKENDRREECH